MHAPVPMLSGAGSSKALAVMAVLAGLFIVAQMQRQQAAPAAQAQPQPR